jgi:hypothetical protein
MAEAQLGELLIEAHRTAALLEAMFLDLGRPYRPITYHGRTYPATEIRMIIWGKLRVWQAAITGGHIAAMQDAGERLISLLNAIEHAERTADDTA